VARERGERRDRAGVERVERRRERVGDELLGLVGEGLVGEVAEVVARGEHPARAGDEDAAGVVVEGVERPGDAVEDRVVERVALGRVRDRQAQDAVGRPVGEDLAADGREI
jgi:hypothetical protein